MEAESGGEDTENRNRHGLLSALWKQGKETHSLLKPLKSECTCVSSETRRSHSIPVAPPSASPPICTLNLSFPIAGLLIPSPSLGFLYILSHFGHVDSWSLGSWPATLAFPHLSLLSWPSSVWMIPDDPGYFFPHIYNKPSLPLIPRRGHVLIFVFHSLCNTDFSLLRLILDSISKTLIVSIVYFKLLHLWLQAAEIRNSCSTILPGFFTDHRLTPPQSPPLHKGTWPIDSQEPKYRRNSPKERDNGVLV